MKKYQKESEPIHKRQKNKSLELTVKIVIKIKCTEHFLYKFLLTTKSALSERGQNKTLQQFNKLGVRIKKIPIPKQANQVKGNKVKEFGIIILTKLLNTLEEKRPGDTSDAWYFCQTR